MTKLVKGFQEFSGLNAWKREYLIQDLNLLGRDSGFDLLLLPNIEFANTFEKAMGATSNIVQKEFFYCSSRNDLNTRALVLRPELTSGVIRYFSNHKQLNLERTHSIFTYGDCFRYEKPQKGRYRQFLQWNMEQINFKPEKLNKILSLLKSILSRCELLNEVVIEINYLTKLQLKTMFNNLYKYQNKFNFCQLCRQRFLVRNVHRILDCQDCRHFLQPYIDLPSLLNDQEKVEYQKYYQLFQLFFPKTKIIQNPVLTRGLDYYTGLVFEIKSRHVSWSKKTIIAGGSYLINAFSTEVSDDILGFGFAIGVDRLLLTIEEMKSLYFQTLCKQIEFFVMIGSLKKDFIDASYQLQSQLVEMNLSSKVLEKSSSFHELLTKALQQKVKWLLVFGREFEEEQKVVVRKINQKSSEKETQYLFTFAQIVAFFAKNNYE